MTQFDLDVACTTSHYATIVDAKKDVQIYQVGDDACPTCLRLMAAKHEQVARIFRDKIALLIGGAS